MQIQDLRTSITQMSDKESLELILEIRRLRTESRSRVAARRATAAKKTSSSKKPIPKPSDMTPEQALALLTKLTGGTPND